MKKLADPFTALSLPLCALWIVSSTARGQGFEAETPSLGGLANPSALAIGDLDGDGVEDIVIVDTGSASARWSKGTGDGSFLAGRDMTPGFELQGAQSVTTADLDGDGDDDVVFTGGSSTPVGWLESLGGGAFSPPTILVNGTNPAGSVSAADLDGDALPDVLFRRGDRRAFWIRNLGGGSFAPPALIATTTGRYSCVIAADLDSDGDLDVIMSDQSNDGIQWAENLGGASFAAGVFLGLGANGPLQVAASDLDGDGDTDLIATTASFPRYFENLGGLTFSGTAFFGSIDATSLVLIDVDGDGLDDCVTGSDELSRLELNLNAGGSFSAPSRLVTRHDRIWALTAGDLDADGDADLASAGAAVEVHLQAGVSFAAGLPIALPPLEITSVALGDLDGDGLVDLALTENSGSGSYAWLRNQGGGTWSQPMDALSLRDAAQVEAVDVDSDGDLDLVASGGSFDSAEGRVAWAQNLGGGSFAPSVTLHSDGADSAAKFRVGDMDGDGDLDILWFHLSLVFAQERFEWITQVAPGAFTRGTILPDNSLTREFELEDLDDDGDADIVLVSFFGDDAVTWRANDGTGAFGPEQPIEAPGTTGAFKVGVGDIDGDGRPDVVTFGFGVRWYRAQASGGFAGPIDLEFPLQQPVLGRLDDADGDGRLDVTVSGSGAAARWYRNLGAGSFGPAQQIPGPAAGSLPGQTVVGIGDLDGDLDLDLLKRSPDGTLGWNRGTARFGEAFCGPGVVNSRGSWGVVSAAGSREIADNDVTLIAERLPSASFGYFLIAPLDGFVSSVPGSQGSLCLGGPIGRLNRGTAEIFQATMDGFASRRLDVLDVPTPTGATSLLPGDTRYFQAWYRDANPGPTSNFTSGLLIHFE